MNKNYIFVICSFMLLSLPASAAIYTCKNSAGKIGYQDRPCESESQEKIIQQKSKGRSSTGKLDASQVKTIKFLDNLKKCNSFATSYKLPFFGKIKNEIIGKNSGLCHVITHTDLGGKVVCNYSDETIALLTSEKKYQEIKTGKFSRTSYSLEAARMSAECTVPNE